MTRTWTHALSTCTCIKKFAGVHPVGLPGTAAQDRHHVASTGSRPLLSCHMHDRCRLALRLIIMRVAAALQFMRHDVVLTLHCSHNFRVAAGCGCTCTANLLSWSGFIIGRSRLTRNNISFNSQRRTGSHYATAFADDRRPVAQSRAVMKREHSISVIRGSEVIIAT